MNTPAQGPSSSADTWFDVRGIPDELSALSIWNVWDPTQGKMPRCADGSLAHSDRPATWMTFENAVRVARQKGWGIGLETAGLPEGMWTGDVDGIFGFHPTEKDAKGDPRKLTAEEGVLHPNIRQFLKMTSTCTMWSPSRAGYRLIGQGIPDLGGNKSGRTLIKPNGEHGEVAVFTGNKFMTITGWVVPGMPTEILPVEFPQSRTSTTIEIEVSIDLEDLPVPLAVKAAIVSGIEADDAGEFEGDRSKQLLWVVGSLWRTMVPEDRIFAICLNPDYAISKHPLAQGGGARRAVERCLERAREDGVNEFRGILERCQRAKPKPKKGEPDLPTGTETIDDVVKWLLTDEKPQATLKRAKESQLNTVLLSLPISETRRSGIRRAVAKVEVEGDSDGFRFTEKGEIDVRSMHNVRVALRRIDANLSYNEFTDEIHSNGQVLDSAGLIRLQRLVEDKCEFLPYDGVFKNAVLDAAREDTFHPVKQYLDSLPAWDGEGRVDLFLHQFCGVEDTTLTRAFSRCFLIAAVRRIRHPGVRFARMLILQGVQGAGKSSMLAALVPVDDWFTNEAPLEKGAKERIEAFRGKWIIEVEELEAMSKAEVNHLKAVISKTCDEGTLKYDRLRTKMARSSIFVGSTNENQFLMDRTGNVRFWPVSIPKGFLIDLDAIRRERDQVWSEASVREARGDEIDLPPNLWRDAAEQAAKYENLDTWEAKLLSEMPDAGKIKPEELAKVLGFDSLKDFSIPKQKVLHEIMTKLGWSRGTKSFDGRKTWCYWRGEGKLPEILCCVSGEMPNVKRELVSGEVF